MALYRKFLPYILTSCVVLTGCDYGSDTNGVVLEKKGNNVFVDSDNDKLADQMIDMSHVGINGHAIPKYQAIYDYILPGDSVIFEPHLRGGTANLKSVNGKSLNKIYELVKIRREHNGKLR